MSNQIALACGGTGGHINPALAVATELQKSYPNITLSLILPGNRQAETRAAEAWQGAKCFTGARPMRHLLANFIAWRKCVKFLKQERPKVLFATGGYSCFAPVLAARWLHIPVVLHEANSLAGQAVRELSKRLHIDTVATSFPDTEKQLPWAHVEYTGLPLRASVLAELAKSSSATRNDKTFTIFVTGGSQGAYGMDMLVGPVLAQLAKYNPAIRILHQCGQKSMDELTKIYAEVKGQVTLTRFIESMGLAYGEADLVVARAGAATCFELARCAVPTVFIPLPTAAEDHQTKNAQALVSCGGALSFDQLKTKPEQLAEVIGRMIEDPSLLSGMRAALQKLPQEDAAKKLADLLAKY